MRLASGTGVDASGDSPQAAGSSASTANVPATNRARARGVHRAGARPAAGSGIYTSLRSAAQRDSACRLESCVLRSTLDTCVSTVFTEMKSSPAISL